MEEWKAIPGYEGLYEISNLGRVKSVDRFVNNPICGTAHLNEKIKNQRYRIRRTRQDAIISLCKNNRKKTFNVARLVAMVWCSGYKKGLTVNHIDGNTMNNNASNLEWISNEENIRHGHKIGRYKKTERECSLFDKNGKEKRFRTRTEACCFLGRRANYISTREYINSNVAYSISGEKYDFV